MGAGETAAATAEQLEDTERWEKAKGRCSGTGPREYWGPLPGMGT